MTSNAKTQEGRSKLRLLTFLSRHQPTGSEVTLARQLGYPGLEPMDVFFGRDPVADLRAIGIHPPAEIAVVAPGRVIVELLRAGFTVMEFENNPAARARGDFVCTGAYRFTLGRTEYFPAVTEPPSKSATVDSLAEP